MHSSRLFDPVRRKWVNATPEELVRQSVLHWLIGPGGFKPHQIAVERLIPLGSASNSMQRRFDIAIYSIASPQQIGIDAIIECKAGTLTPSSLLKAQRQVMGYQWHCKPKAIVVAAENGSWYNLGIHSEEWLCGIPTASFLKQFS